MSDAETVKEVAESLGGSLTYYGSSWNFLDEDNEELWHIYHIFTDTRETFDAVRHAIWNVFPKTESEPGTMFRAGVLVIPDNGPGGYIVIDKWCLNI